MHVAPLTQVLQALVFATRKMMRILDLIFERMIIRPAQELDCPRLFSLIHELAVYEQAPQEVTVTLAHFTECGFGASPIWWAIVAKDTEKGIVGFALYYIRYSTWKGQRMYLEDIIVTEASRGQGIGKMLMDELIQEAKRKKFCGISWQVLQWNEPAINFYKKYNTSFDNEWVNVMLAV